MSHQPTYCYQKCCQNPVLHPRFFLPKGSKNCHFNLALETKGFSPGGTTSLLSLKPRHNTLILNTEFIVCFIPFSDKCWLGRNLKDFHKQYILLHKKCSFSFTFVSTFKLCTPLQKFNLKRA